MQMLSFMQNKNIIQINKPLFTLIIGINYYTLIIGITITMTKVWTRIKCL
jgi:hypothetical protein